MLTGMNTILERLYVLRYRCFIGFVLSKSAHFECDQDVLPVAVSECDGSQGITSELNATQLEITSQPDCRCCTVAQFYYNSVSGRKYLSEMNWIILVRLVITISLFFKLPVLWQSWEAVLLER